MNYDKNKVKEELEIENIFELVREFGGNPTWTEFGFISDTICHNEPGEGSHKLYFYTNSSLFQCYTGCGFFDIFELVQKVFRIQHRDDLDLNDAVRWVARRFGIFGTVEDKEEKKEDWKILDKYDRIKELDISENKIILDEYESTILNFLNYDIILTPWEKEGISRDVITKAHIGYYPGGDQITIPHYDENDRLIGIRGRTMCQEEAELYGKYRPLRIQKQQYNHPLSLNLYGLNWAKENIKKTKKVVVTESEKSVLLGMSYFGIDNDIFVATCGSTFSQHNMQTLLDLGVEEIVIAFDREGEKDDKKHYVSKFYKINSKLKNYAKVSFIYDKDGKYLDYKQSPLDCGIDTFMKLFKERIYL